MDRDTEKRLIEQARHDSSAFGLLFEEYYDGIVRYCIYHTAQVEIARDIAAETFFKALRNLKRYTSTDVPFSVWLFRIARNEIIDYFRKKNRHTSLFSRVMEQEGIVGFDQRPSLQDEAAALQRKLDNDTMFRRIRGAMGTLPLHYRDVLVLRFMEEKSIAEIGVILGKKEGTVKSLISRGVSMLREISFREVQPSDDVLVTYMNPEERRSHGT